MKSPFKFLDSYTKDDRDIFFGRDREIEELYQKVFESKLMLVYGVSGSGKSSLIHCGLANKFLETDWLQIVVRRGENMIESLSSSILAVSITPQQIKLEAPIDFKKGVRSLYLDHYKPIFFIFDQFEELFIFGNKEERRSFINIVKILTESDLQCRMIFVMREEYMGWITEFEKVIPTFFSNRIRIEKMSHLNALEAIKGPCLAFNITLEDGFAEALLEKLSPGSSDVELTYLQVFLDKIYNLAKEGSNQKYTSFSIPLLLKVGNVSDLLSSFLDEQISLMEDPEAAMTVLKAFVSSNGTKRLTNEKEAIGIIHSFGKTIDPDTVREFLQVFIKLRILKYQTDNDRFELRHDALAEKIYEKFSTAEKELIEIKQYIENAYQYFLKRKVTLSNEDLIYISDKDSLLNLDHELKNFMVESRKRQLAKHRTIRWLTYASSAAFFIIICFLAYYVSTKIEQTQGNNMAIKSISQLTNPLERLKMATLSWEKSHNVLPKEALLKAYNETINSITNDSLINILSSKHRLIFDKSPVPIQYAECSIDNKYIFGYGDSLILLWNINGKLERVIKTNHFPMVDIKISDDNKLLGTVSKDSMLTVFSIQGDFKFTYKVLFNELNTNDIFSFTKNKNIITLSKYFDAVLLDSLGNTIQSFNHHSGSVNAVAISPDNNFLAFASSDKCISIWYLNSVRNDYSFYNTLDYHKDTVWSVSFSNNNISVLSSSADKKVIVGTINNERIGDTGFQTDLKYSEAKFSKSNDGITAVAYEFSKYEPVKYYRGNNYNNPLINMRTEFIHGSFSYLYAREKFSYLTMSDDESYFAFSKFDRSWLADNCLLLEKDGRRINFNYILMEIKGSKPFFTADNKYILALNINSIQALYIDVEEIYKVSVDLLSKFGNSLKVK